MKTLTAEGDVNLSPLRRAWEDEHLHESTRRLIDSDSEHFLHQSLSTPCLNALAACEGIWLTDVEGRRVMDFHGNNVHQIGYRHPRVIEAIKQQLDTLPFSPRRYTNAAAVALAAKLARLAPDPLSKVLFAPGGALAIGMALKLARVATGRHKTLSLWDSFHGASLDAISISGEALFRRDAGPLLPGAEHAPPCDPVRSFMTTSAPASRSAAAHLVAFSRKNGSCVPATRYVRGIRLGITSVGL